MQRFRGTVTRWFIVGGAVALIMAFAAGRVRRMPLNTSVVYLIIGYLLGSHGFGLLEINPSEHSRSIEAIAELAIVISIFSGALKLRLPLFDRRWFDPLRLALLSMAISVAGGTLAAHYALGMPLGAALLLAAILAPTDPVLASDVQVERPYTFSRLRFALTGEAGMNDGAAMPLVLLGLALIRVEPLTTPPWAWVLQHVIWGFAGAIAIGGLTGYLGGRYMLHLRLHRGEKLGTDNFLALGLVGLSYGLATAAGALGFVAVFAAGVAARGVERRMTEQPPETIAVRVGEPGAEQPVANDPDTAAAFMLLRLESFTGNLERIGEAVVVILLGALLAPSMLTGSTLVFAPLLLFAIRPASVFLGLLGSPLRKVDRSMAAWFGIRGMASVYYVAFIHQHGVPPELVHSLAAIVLGVITWSIALHGISATPLMSWLEKQQ
jgi:sodium/hydrogen antiporter